MLNVPFCPIKQKLRKKQSEVSMVKIPQHKVTKWDIFLSTLYLIIFVQSDSKTFTAAVYSKFYKLIKEDLRKGIGILSFYIVL